MATIPFENLDVLLGKAISISRDGIISKILDERRGGYCFEHNHLFRWVLEEIGFKVVPMISRVRWQAASDEFTPLTHMILKVEVDGQTFLADVGYGGLGLIEPLAFDIGKVQHEGFEPRRLVERGRDCVHQVLIKEVWEDLYQFEAAEVLAIDLEVGNWYSCTHPDAHFKNAILTAVATDRKRIILNNTKLTIRHYTGEVVVRELESYEEVIEVLETEFGLSLPSGERLNCPELIFDADK
ncbi:arylamine N-acetyltransferase [Puniceicoccaceae bacterium K14]|nr:arylamine N-acetyltransferase [Puniceicoccaceae bacterium K14]